MANKTLTAKVRLNTRQVETKLQQIARGIDALNKALGRQTNAYKSVNTALNQSVPKIKQAKVNTDQLANSADRTNKNFQKTSSSVSTLTNKIKTLAGAYLGLQSIKLGVTTSDKITSSKNLLNNLEGGSAELTEQTMDKVYAAAQRSRTGYTDMLHNVGKTMTLAPKAFQNNIDNAVRFQEIMAKAYTVGGASAQEMSTSMYQLTQALGAGILAGDELRSVREGAPLAYKEIERFAQENLKTTKSLKDLASEGVITSDIVVAAIMNAGDKIDKKFENTQMTFAQAWTSIKNVATQTFRDVSARLEETLNSDTGRKAIEEIQNAIVGLGNALVWVVDILAGFFGWCVDNWSWLKHIIAIVFIALMAYTIVYTALAIKNAYLRMKAWIAEHKAMLKTTAVIAVIIIAIYLLWQVWQSFTSGAIDACTAIVYALAIVGAAILIIGIILGSVPMMIIGAVLLLLAVIFMFFEQICGGIAWVGAFFKNVGLSIANFFIAVWNWISTAFQNCGRWIVNVAKGLWNSMKAIAQNIGIAFENAWIGAQNMFWKFIQNCLEGVKSLEPVINSVAKAFGAEGFTLSGVIDTVAGKQQATKSYVSVGDAWSSGYHANEYKSLSDAWNEGINTYDVFQDGWGKEAYASGVAWGANIKESINQWGSQFQNEQNKENEAAGNGLPDISANGINGVNGAYDPTGANEDIAKGIKKIGDDTGDISDKMDLTEEDLDYLRRIADMEWKKEFTTANITFEVNNNNNINNEQDIYTLAVALRDVVMEDLETVAYGVYD